MASRSGRQETGTGEGKYVQDRHYNEKHKYDEPIPYEGTQEDPAGEEIEVPYIGQTWLFTEHQDQVAEGLNKRHLPFLPHHVPLNMRGQYKLLDFPGEFGERMGPSNYAMCSKKTFEVGKNGVRMREEGRPCRSKAVNYSGACASHGGMLHPLDRKRIDWEKAPRHIKFKYGRLPVSELDDEELSRGQVRKEDGTFTSNEYVSAEIHDAMVKKLFERSDEMMRNNLLSAVDTMAEIAAGTAYEPADRLRAAEFIFKWLRGSTPIKVEVGVTKPFEQVLDAILVGGSRGESRARRGIEDVVDAEVVEDDELDLPDIPGLDGQEEYEEEISDVEDESWDYRDERDRPVSADFEPEKVVHYGPAGAPTYRVPPNLAMNATEHEHHLREDENVIAAEDKRAKFAKKRKTPEETAAERKMHNEEVRAALKKRKYFQNQGQSSLPEPLDGTVEDNEDGSIQVVFEKPAE